MEKVINSPNAPQAIGPYVHGRVLNGIAYLSGQLGVDPKTNQLVEGVEAQTKQAFSNIRQVLESYGATLADIVKVTVMIDDIEDFQTINQIYETQFQQPYPARSMFAVNDLPRGGLVEIEVIADVSHLQ